MWINIEALIPQQCRDMYQCNQRTVSKHSDVIYQNLTDPVNGLWKVQLRVTLLNHLMMMEGSLAVVTPSAEFL